MKHPASRLLLLGMVLCLAAPALAGGLAIQNNPRPIDVDIEVGHDGGEEAWVVSPVWLAIGGIAVVLVLVLAVMASRGSGTTVVHDR